LPLISEDPDNAGCIVLTAAAVETVLGGYLNLLRMTAGADLEFGLEF